MIAMRTAWRGAVLVGTAAASLGAAVPGAALRAQGQGGISLPARRAEPVAPKAEPVDPAASGEIQLISPSAAQFERATSFFNQGQYGAAIQEFLELLKQFPNTNRKEEALFRIAESYRQLGKAADADAAFAYLVSEFPEGVFAPTARLRQGDALYRAGKYAEALPLFEQAAKGESDTQMAARYMRAVTMLQLPDRAAAGRKELESLIADPKAKDYAGSAAQTLAGSYEKAGDLKAAAAAWKRALDLAANPEAKAMAAARAGWVLLQMGKAADAEAMFELARRDNVPGEWRRVANTGLMKLYYTSGRSQQLLDLQAAEKTEFLESAREELLFATGHAYYLLKDYPAAVAAFDRFLQEFGTRPAAPAAAYERLLARIQIEPDALPAEAKRYLKDFPQSDQASRVQLMLAEHLSSKKDFAAALPVWQALAARLDQKQTAGAPPLPREGILFELARALYELQQWDAAAEQYGRFAQEFGRNPSALAARVRQAIALQNAGKMKSAAGAWESVRKNAPAKSKEKQMALEQLGLIYRQAGQEDAMAAAFQELVRDYPQSPIHAFAFYAIGEHAFAKKDWRTAESALIEARKLDPATWQLTASERLALLGFATKDPAKTAAYVKEYELAAAGAKQAPSLPAALYFWLGQELRKSGQSGSAVIALEKVRGHPDPGDFAIPALWELAEAQRESQQFADAVANYEAYRKAKPDLADANQVLLALGRAYLGAGQPAQARAWAEKVMLQSPEGLDNARARLLLGETYEADNQPGDAAKAYAALALLYDDPAITPQAMAKAAAAFEKAGDPTSAATWRANLQKRFPNARSAPPAP